MVIKINDATFKGFIEEGISMVKLGAEWCNPCVSLDSVINEISPEYSNIKIGKLDIDESPEITKELGVRSVPTTFIYKDGEVLERFTGNIPKAQLKSLLDKYLN